MRKTTGALHLLLLVNLLAIGSISQCHIYSDTNPPVLLPGQTHTFVATGCGIPTWSLVGPGSINPSTGVYSAPSTVQPQQQSRGVQLLANDSIYNTPIDMAGVDPNSSTWLTRIQQYYGGSAWKGHTLVIQSGGGIGFFDNPVDNTTPTEPMTVYYNATNHDGILMPIPSRRVWKQQEGVSGDFWLWDHHSSMVNHDTGVLSEVYQLMVDGGTADYVATDPSDWTRSLVRFPSVTIWQVTSPRTCVISGSNSWPGFDQKYTDCKVSSLCGLSPGHICYSVPYSSHGFPPITGTVTVSPIDNSWHEWDIGTGDCSGCTAESAARWNNTDDAIMPGPGVDAAGTPVDATVFHPMEIYRAVQLGKNDVGHAIRTTLGNEQIGTRSVWPAADYAYGGRPSPNIGSASNGNPTTLTLSTSIGTSHPCYDTGQTDHYGYFSGCTFSVYIYGLTGSWTGLNGSHTATAVGTSGTAITVNVDTTGFGSYPGHGHILNNWMPYGARIRLKSTFNNSSVCTAGQPWTAACNVIINTLKKYGLVLTDGTDPLDSWESGESVDEWTPQEVRDAEVYITSNLKSSLVTFDQQLEVVDTSSYQVTTDPNSNRYGAATPSQTVVTAHGNSGDASIAVLLLGTAVDVFPHQLTMVSGTSWQLQPWVTGNTNTNVTYNISPSIPNVSLSSGGLINVGGVSSLKCTVITITSLADSNATAYQHLCVVPVSPDGKIRLALGQMSTTYTDSGGNVWYSQETSQSWNDFQPRPFADGYPWLLGSYQVASWSSWGNPDRDLYNHSINSLGDIAVRLIVPNGDYYVTTYHEPGCLSPPSCPIAAKQNIYDVEVQGAVPSNMQYLDAYNLASGTYMGFNLVNTATVSDNMLEFALRQRFHYLDYGPSISSVLITPK